MPASALTGRQALSGRNWRAFDMRTIAYVRSATSWQRRQPGSRGRARRARTGLPVHERAPGMYPIRTMARVLKVSASGYYAWRSRPVSARATADAGLTRHIRTIHAGSHATYGAPRVHAELKADGLSVGRKRIARLMRVAGIAGVSRRRSAPITTRPAANHHPASDLVRRNFMAERPNELWVAQIPFPPTLGGFLYLAVVLDAWSRRIVGWAFSADLKTRVVLDALDMALMARKP